MIHYVVYPSANRQTGIDCANKWRAKGYKTLVALDVQPDGHMHEWQDSQSFDAIDSIDKWDGYYAHIGDLVRRAFLIGANIVTCVGDDMEPPTQGADAIAEMYFKRFPDGYGVLQGTGDPQGVDDTGRCAAARICGSPTFGRAWAERGFGGFVGGYHSFYGDEALKEVAERCGVLWMEPSICIFHRHWSWHHQPRQDYHIRNQSDHWEQDRNTFMRMKITGFREQVKEFKR